MKKIRLIEPKVPGYNIYTFWPLPRLGLPIMGAILKKRGYEVIMNLVPNILGGLISKTF
jgi:hypothetical protein